jgi:predicted enzyme related to lactoylglutathione lyase
MRGYNRGKSPHLRDGIALTHFIVAADIERATHFYGDVLAARSPRRRADDRRARKQLDHHQRRRRTNGRQTERRSRAATESRSCRQLLELRVADIQAVYQTWSERGAHFLTPPIDRGPDTRCYLRDPDGT